MIAKSRSFAHNSAMRELDRAIIRVAIANARLHLSQGSPPAEAAKLATPGAWAEFRFTVLKALQDEADRPPAPMTATRN